MGSEDLEKASASGGLSLVDYLALLKEERERRKRRAKSFHELQNAGRALYSDEQGQPVLRESFAVFIDELGTSRRMKNYSNDDLADDLALYDDARLSLHSPVDRSDEYARPLYFTDNVMLAVPASPEDKDKGLGYALGVVAEYQARLATMGRFSRGAITYGKLYADNSFGTGPALVKAVNLEKKARSPRVLIDSRCRKLGLAEVSAVPFSPLKPLDAEKFVLHDGKEAFVNYLAAVIDPDSRWCYTDEALEAHARAIRENLDHWAEEERIRRKYEWLADYHDYFVTQILWFPEYLVGSSQSQSFAPLTSRLFELGDLVGEPLATTFHQASAKEDVKAIMRAGWPELAELYAAEYPDLRWFLNTSGGPGMAIHSLCMLRERLRDGCIPGQYAADVSEVVRYSESVIRAVAFEVFELQDYYVRQAFDRLVALADALKVVRLSPQHCDVGRRKILDLAQLVGLRESD